MYEAFQRNKFIQLVARWNINTIFQKKKERSGEELTYIYFKI